MLRDGLMLYCQIALQQTTSMPLLTICAVMVAWCMCDIVLSSFYYFYYSFYYFCTSCM